MASAGRILIMPKGDYNAETQYEMLDLVGCDNHAWICKKTCKGIKPTSDVGKEYWHDLFGVPLNLISDDLIIKDYGVLLASNVYTALSAKKDEENSRFIRVINQLYSEDTTGSLQFVEFRDGAEKVYNILGEHNAETLLNKKANGGVAQFSANPGGNDYIVKTFNIKNHSDLVFFANTAGMNGVYVSGVIITAFETDSVTVTIHLNKEYDGDITFFVGWNKVLYE